MNLPCALVLMLILCSSLDFCSCTDTILSGKSINDSETIVSNGGTFKLGFFTPANSTKRYVGIFYNIPLRAPIWVANRDKPLNDSFGSVTISDDGNIVVLDGRKRIVWSSNVSYSLPNSTAKLLDTGNLVLQGNSSGITLWESFQHLSDSYVRNMRLSMNVHTGQKNVLTSWRSPSDPSIGSFSFGLDPLNIPEMFVWNGSNPLWRSGPWNGQIFIGVAGMTSDYRRGFLLEDDRQGSVSLTSRYNNDSVIAYYMLSSEGNLMERYWLEGLDEWAVSWSSLQDECDVYGKCGPFGICSSQKSPICSCLKGFEPVDMEEWSKGNWSSGCARRTPLKCDSQNTTRIEVKDDGFLKFSNIKVPDFAESSIRIDDCEKLCFSNCSCIAYAFYPGIGCMVWNGSLIDIRKFSGSNGTDLYLRVANSELDKRRSVKVVIATAVIVGTITSLICSYVVWNFVTRKRGRKQKNGQTISGRDNSDEAISESTINRVKVGDLQIFNFEKLADATRNFHIDNKLGQGGFGPVYKGTLPDGQEIAIKRLSRSSGQGMEEFMNEVVVISKLQHRNLVRLLGCCVEREEKMLIYEYMPNGSLDSHLFDPLGQEHLDWSQRARIIEGIARGLLYLHRDSRLKIIHRDLKASNILLDQDLNPKISDFGMARIFGGDQDQANTRRVVGTYGYMAPEYAMEGRFSEKSDVYSFGVLMLEIVSGRRNSSFYNDENTLSLLRFAWKLWNEGKIVELIDSEPSGPSSVVEIVRYIHVGLLCVQEFAKDRPIVSTILPMLSSEISDLPIPKQPAFTEGQSSSESQKRSSVNNVSITLIEAR